MLIASQAGLYACAIVLALAELLLTTPAVSAAPPPQPRPAPPSEPDAAQIQQRLLGSLIDQTPAPLLMLRPDGVVEVSNRAARTLFRTEDRLVDPPPALIEVLAKGAPKA